MKKWKIIPAFFLLFILTELNGQVSSCNDDDKHYSVLDENRIHRTLTERINDQSLRNNERDTIIINPVIMRSSDGSIASTTIDLLDQSIAAANEYFRFSDIYFKYCGKPSYMDDDKFYYLTLDEGEQLNKQLHVENTINIYIAESITESFPDGSFGLYCGIASFPKPETESRYILIKGSCLEDPTLLSHELGHFYGLFHTHETAFGEELVSKINCEIAGDFICDTPADPLLNNSNVFNCSYFGQAVDMMGENYRPDTRNIMSYAPIGCRSRFSWQQLFRMRDVHLNENSYLMRTCDFPDFSVKIDTFFAAFRPGQSIDLPLIIYNLGSKKVQGLTIDAYVSDNVETRSELLSSSKILFPVGQSQLNLRLNLKLPVDLPETTQHIIIDLDAAQELKELDESNNSAFLTYKVDYGNLSDVSIYPNPTPSTCRIFMRSEPDRGQVIIDIYDRSGRLVQQEKRFKAYDTFQAEMDVSLLTKGMYFISVRIEDSEPNFLKMIKL
jgi:hypothetical protein